MAKLQLLTGYINLAGSRDNVVFRDITNPLTFPETIVLAAIHGGAEHVHGLVQCGEVERDNAEEMERLTRRYGKFAQDAFPVIAGKVALPEGDASIPTQEEVAAVEAAKVKARENFRAPAAKAAKAPEKPKAAPVASEQDTLPSLDELPQ